MGSESLLIAEHKFAMQKFIDEVNKAFKEVFLKHLQIVTLESQSCRDFLHICQQLVFVYTILVGHSAVASSEI